MQREQKLAILMEGQKNGIQKTCLKHGLSRTLYYRWLKRYKAQGVSGLDPISRDFIPPNKTDSTIHMILLTLIKKYPHFGPRALKYELDYLGYNISESAVYNMLRAQQLSTRAQRAKYAKKRVHQDTRELPDFFSLNSGEGWIFWTTLLGNFKSTGTMYLYTFLDYKSKIACSRLYQTLTVSNFENLLTGVAMPVAQTLQFDAKYLYIPKDDLLCGKSPDQTLIDIEKSTHSSGFDVVLSNQVNKDEDQKIQQLRHHYTHLAVNALLGHFQEGLSTKEIKHKLQEHIRTYNLYHKSLYEGALYSPVEYHAMSKQTEMILPLWAYIDRDY
jgi:transposase